MQHSSLIERANGILARYRRHLALVLIPALTLAGLIGGLTTAALLVAAATQLIILLWVTGYGSSRPEAADDAPTVKSRDHLDDVLANLPPDTQSAALVIRIDSAARIKDMHGQRLSLALQDALGQQLARALREQDHFCLLSDDGFGVALCPQRSVDVGAVLSIAQRIQTRLSQPFRFEGLTLWPSVSVGFCLSPRAAALNGIGMLDAAQQAAAKALNSGPGGISSYSVVDFPAAVSADTIGGLRKALETGEIHAFFQPQVRTATGEVSGFEALARWQHPERGLISPAEFLPQIEAAGLAANLATCMLRDAMTTLAKLDAAGYQVPTISVNLSADELRNPRLADEISWELDRNDLTPDRLTVEILETVVADSDEDVAVRNIARLAGLGCGIDLDDFGTGHASIANIRRFAVGRIKIDRSFVTRMHEDEDQQRMVSAILSMARHLEVLTLAEGVECAEEQVMLAQMGCHHLQGYAIARPMPAEDLIGWLDAHNAALACGEPWCEDSEQQKTASRA
ncbi:EAL domain-containing protein [Pararhodobacter oceanensis]|uniref:EAL domain-containing protein n=1 Tax=Pararhodobacter oceanensis TaxID=2172121 RepID=UPI003A91AC7A